MTSFLSLCYCTWWSRSFPYDDMCLVYLQSSWFLHFGGDSLRRCRGWSWQGCDRSLRSQALPICFSQLDRKASTKHGIYVELLAHVVEFLSELGVGFDLVLVSLGKLIQVGLKIRIGVFDLHQNSLTANTFFSISALAASLFFFYFSLAITAALLPVYIE